jgi:hypothetical protein
MNGLPLGIDLTPLFGRVVMQICFGEFQFILHFDRSVRIGVESKCVLVSACGVSKEITDYTGEASHLCELIGKEVTWAGRGECGGVNFKFSDGSSLQILNSNQEYESFQIHLEDMIFVA